MNPFARNASANGQASVDWDFLPLLQFCWGFYNDVVLRLMGLGWAGYVGSGSDLSPAPFFKKKKKNEEFRPLARTFIRKIIKLRKSNS